VRAFSNKTAGAAENTLLGGTGGRADERCLWAPPHTSVPHRRAAATPVGGRSLVLLNRSLPPAALCLICFPTAFGVGTDGRARTISRSPRRTGSCWRPSHLSPTYKRLFGGTDTGNIQTDGDTRYHRQQHSASMPHTAAALHATAASTTQNHRLPSADVPFACRRRRLDGAARFRRTARRRAGGMTLAGRGRREPAYAPRFLYSWHAFLLYSLPRATYPLGHGNTGALLHTRRVHARNTTSYPCRFIAPAPCRRAVQRHACRLRMPPLAHAAPTLPLLSLSRHRHYLHTRHHSRASLFAPWRTARGMPPSGRHSLQHETG